MVEAIITVRFNYNGIQQLISEIASMIKDAEESNAQFLRRLRTDFNRILSAKTNSSASYDVLFFAVRKNMSSLRVRVDDRSMAKISSQVLKSTIGLAAQVSHVGISSAPSKPEKEFSLLA